MPKAGDNKIQTRAAEKLQYRIAAALETVSSIRYEKKGLDWFNQVRNAPERVEFWLAGAAGIA